MPMITSEKMNRFYTPDRDIILIQGAESVHMVCDDLLKVIKDNTKEFKISMVSKVQKFQQIQKGQPIPMVAPEQLWEKVFTPKWYGARLSIHKHDLEDGEAIISSSAELDKVFEVGKGYKEDLDTRVAHLFMNALAADADTTLTPDGIALCAAGGSAHPYSPTNATVLVNYLAKDFTPDVLEEFEELIDKNAKDSNGEIMSQVQPTVCLYGPSMHGTVLRTLDERATYLEGTGDRKLNIHAGTYKPLKWKKITDNRVFLIQPKYHMEIIVRQKLHAEGFVDPSLKYIYWDNDARDDIGFSDWRGVWCMKG